VGTQGVVERADTGVTGSRRSALSLRRPGARCLALFALFVLVAWSVELGWWSHLDQSLTDWAAARRRSPLWDPAKTVFDIATPEVALPVTLALGALAAWLRHRWSVVAEAAIRVGLVVASVLVLKPLLAVPGPTRNALGGHGGAFPSGHTTSTLVCAALLLTWLGRPRGAVGRALLMALLVAVVGASVVYLHYHYFSDVVGGVVLGLAIATMPLPGRLGWARAQAV
jgi:membrane-associated phospholipid phosphatase